ncbi:MAG: hypothetical protein WBE55_22145 [Candidatus Sulfotelmatobacter sp.]
MSKNNVYTVNSKILDLQNRVLELEKANKTLRQHVETTLSTKINDSQNVIRSAQESDFRELKASIRIPQDGAPGRDGQSIVGPKGEAGDVTVIGESEMAKAVIDARRKLKMLHATYLAHLIESIEANRRSSSSASARILASHLETVKRELEKLG